MKAILSNWPAVVVCLGAILSAFGAMTLAIKQSSDDRLLQRKATRSPLWLKRMPRLIRRWYRCLLAAIATVTWTLFSVGALVLPAAVVPRFWSLTAENIHYMMYGSE